MQSNPLPIATLTRARGRRGGPVLTMVGWSLLALVATAVAIVVLLLAVFN